MAALLVLAALTAVSAPAEGAKGDGGAVARLGQGHRAFRAGDYAEAARALAAAAPGLGRNRDYAFYLWAESEFFAGDVARAGQLFAELMRMRSSRFAAVAAWRQADCLWAEGKRREAASAYRPLVRSPPREVDPVVARFRLAEWEGESTSAEAARPLFRQIYLESPSHPLAEEAARRAGGPAGISPETSGPGDAVAPEERLRRAGQLARERRYEAALEELGKLPPELPNALRAERDFEVAMAKYRMRRDYAQAAALLLGVVPHFSGERAAFAAFHGARALSRADRDDEAIAGYLKVVERFPTSRWAPEAQFLAGWLEFNRGAYDRSLEGLDRTLARFGRSSFAQDAAWYLMLAHHLSGRPREAAAALDRYARLAGQGAGSKVSYWRGRLEETQGRGEGARLLWRRLAGEAPLSYYGLLAQARLRSLGEGAAPALRRRPAPTPRRRPVVRDPDLARADELLRAGLDVEAGVELERAEKAIEGRLGRAAALPVLLDRYPRMRAFSRAYELARVRGRESLRAAPEGEARLVWEAAYPRAYRELVDKYGPPAGNPDLFLYAIMQKESGYDPKVVSYADARGLLQLIPALGERLSADENRPFFADELYQPGVNVRLGAAHIGALCRRFRGQVFLAAGAYNAGVGPVERWLEQHGARPLDEFVELVTYEQTREYIKRVLAIYARYRLLYAGETYLLPLTIDRRRGGEG